jgi:hypothetical protein
MLLITGQYQTKVARWPGQQLTTIKPKPKKIKQLADLKYPPVSFVQTAPSRSETSNRSFALSISATR